MKDFAQHKAQLEDERTRLERMIAVRETSARDHGDRSVNDAFPNSGDSEFADGASNLYDQELDITMLNKYRDRLSDIKVALLRYDKGTFGRCIRCHAEISDARLAAIPETAFCRNCEGDVELQA